MALLMKSRRSSSKESLGNGKPESPSVSAGTKSHIQADPGAYIRPLGNMETFMGVAGEYGSFNAMQAIWLESTVPINPSDVHKALLEIVQKTHILQVCVEWRGLKPWFKQMKEFAFDFKVEEDEFMTVFYQQMHQTFDMKNGPLWSARLVPIQQKKPSDSHRAVLMFCMQHCITDGYTYMQICRLVLEVLNANCTGRVYEVPVHPVIPAVSDSLATDRDFYYGFKYFWAKVYDTVTKNHIAKTNLQGALKPPRRKKALTKVLRHNFTTEETSNLLRHCKENGVAMHSFIMATSNLAFLKAMQQRTKETVDKARINCINSVNMRRYFPDEFKEALGCHISGDEKDLLIPSSAATSKENFWSLVKVIQNNLNNSLLVSYTPIRNTRLLRLYTLLVRVNYELTRHGLKNLTDSHISCTNMGNLKTMLPAKYNGPVKITDMIRSGNAEYAGVPFVIVCHTFDNRFMISLDYYTTKTTDEAAEQFFSILISYFSNAARYGTVQEPS